MMADLGTVTPYFSKMSALIRSFIVDRMTDVVQSVNMLKLMFCYSDSPDTR